MTHRQVTFSTRGCWSIRFAIGEMSYLWRKYFKGWQGPSNVRHKWPYSTFACQTPEGVCWLRSCPGCSRCRQEEAGSSRMPVWLWGEAKTATYYSGLCETVTETGCKSFTCKRDNAPYWDDDSVGQPTVYCGRRHWFPSTAAFLGAKIWNSIEDILLTNIYSRIVSQGEGEITRKGELKLNNRSI